MEIISFVDIDIAKVDVDRISRKGFPEVIYGKGKTDQQIKEIMRVLMDKREPILVTQISTQKAINVIKEFPEATYNADSNVLTAGIKNPQLKNGKVYVVCAGTSDLKIAWETIDVASWMGINVQHVFDVGVAGLDRLLSYREELNTADVIISIAGMEGSLPTVLSGLVKSPVIAVPTSIGYGANLHGLTTMLSMLTSCSSGVTVTNIDNGFGAAYQAGLIIKLLNKK